VRAKSYTMRATVPCCSVAAMEKGPAAASPLVGEALAPCPVTYDGAALRPCQAAQGHQGQRAGLGHRIADPLEVGVQKDAAANVPEVSADAGGWATSCCRPATDVAANVLLATRM